MLKNKTHKIFAVIMLICIIFSVVVIIAFNCVKNDPIDKIAIRYIRNNSTIINQYGEIISIGKNIINKTEKLNNFMNIPYTVHTTHNRILIYVEIKKLGEVWEAISMEVKEVIEDVN